MKIFALCLVAFLAVASPSKSNITAPAAFAIAFESLQATAMTVQTSTGSGSGVLVLKSSGEAYVWTAAHVIGESKTDVSLTKQVVVNGRNVGFYTVKAEVVAVSKEQDLAILRPRSTHFFKAGAQFESALFIPKLGDAVIHCGSMQGLPGAESITTGVVSFAGRVMEDLIFDQTTATAMPGSSGGGVWSVDGKLIGLVVSGYSDTFSFIVPVRRMAAWAAAEKHLEWIP